MFDIIRRSQRVLCICIYLLALGDPCMQSIYRHISLAFVSIHGRCLLSPSLKLYCYSACDNDSERADQFLPYYFGWSDLRKEALPYACPLHAYIGLMKRCLGNLCIETHCC
ncbi:hypothetical protein CRENBAI_024627 [Crenichthys baileyi]|uniref:Secreted protein n=1 Tax=Crenichthys baileyi TaxID=28760 RepID=A0AAV9SGV6_9TELE